MKSMTYGGKEDFPPLPSPKKLFAKDTSENKKKSTKKSRPKLSKSLRAIGAAVTPSCIKKEDEVARTLIYY